MCCHENCRHSPRCKPSRAYVICAKIVFFLRFRPTLRGCTCSRGGTVATLHVANSSWKKKNTKHEHFWRDCPRTARGSESCFSFLLGHYLVGKKGKHIKYNRQKIPGNYPGICLFLFCSGSSERGWCRRGRSEIPHFPVNCSFLILSYENEEKAKKKKQKKNEKKKKKDKQKRRKTKKNEEK